MACCLVDVVMSYQLWDKIRYRYVDKDNMAANEFGYGNNTDEWPSYVLHKVS